MATSAGSPTTAAAPATAATPPTNATPATTAPAAGGVSPTIAPAVAAAQAFLATLDDAGRSGVTFERTQAKLSAWSNLPDGLFKREGLRMADLSAPQQQAAYALLQTLLSPSGYQEVRRIMAADGYLAQTDRNASRLGFGGDHYWIRLLGAPSAATPWTVQFGGHHLAVNTTLAKGQVTMAPSLIAAQPTSYPDGGATVRPMADQTDKAFALAQTLDDNQTTTAILPTTLADLFLGAGADGKTIQQEGLPGSRMTAAQQTQLLDSSTPG